MSDSTQPRRSGGVFIRWWVLLTVVLAWGGLSYIDYQGDRQRDELHLCQTQAMNELHAELGLELGRAPVRPEVWGPEWQESFMAWHGALADCQS